MSASADPTTIHDVRLADYDEILALWRATPGIGLGESDERAPIAAFLERNAGLSVCARDGGRIVGAVLAGHDGRRGYLHHLAVAPAHRRRGLGRRLVEICIARLRSAGIPKCNVFVFADNAEGDEFWRAIGFASRRDLLLLQRRT
jgi:ribosomal protein S18 acetylase RimI-like enzyme